MMIKKILPLILLSISVYGMKNKKAYEKEFKKLSFKQEGKTVKLAKIKKPIVIINFWASWCQPCIAEFKSLNKFIGKYKDHVFVLGVNNDEEKPDKKIAKVTKKYKLKFFTVKDGDYSLAEKFMVSRIPTSIIFFKAEAIKFVPREFDFMGDEFTSMIDKKIKSLD